MDTLDLVLGTLRNLLCHSSEDNRFQDPDLTASVLALRTRGDRLKYEQVLAEINRRGFQNSIIGEEEQITQEPRMKMTVLCKALLNFRDHLGMVQERLAKHIALQ